MFTKRVGTRRRRGRDKDEGKNREGRNEGKGGEGGGLMGWQLGLICYCGGGGMGGEIFI